MKRSVLRFVVLLWPAATVAAPIDFFQLDGGDRTATVVLVKALRSSADNPAPPLLSAVYSYFSTGESATLAYTYRWALAQGAHGFAVGLGAGANTFHSRDQSSDNETGLSLRGQAEAYGPAPAGTYYALLQASTFRNSWLGLIQYTPTGFPVALEMYRQHQETYQATTTALRIATGVERWFLRAGVVRTSGEYRPFVGVTFNGF